MHTLVDDMVLCKQQHKVIQPMIQYLFICIFNSVKIAAFGLGASAMQPCTHKITQLFNRYDSEPCSYTHFSSRI